jgi:hypothetical protein
MVHQPIFQCLDPLFEWMHTAHGNHDLFPEMALIKWNVTLVNRHVQRFVCN